MLAYTLLQVNSEAAHAFAGDAEMDARFDRVYNRTGPALHCRGEPPGPRLHGLGFYAHYYPQSATSPPHANFLPNLAGQDIPTLVIKGRCDYLSWSSAQEYLEAMPDARLLYLDGSGHNAYQDEPERYMAGVRTFLLGRPLPQHPHKGSRMPEDYEGPTSSTGEIAPKKCLISLPQARRRDVLLRICGTLRTWETDLLISPS